MLFRADVVTCRQLQLPASVRTDVYCPPQLHSHLRKDKLASHLLAVLQPQGGSTVAYSGGCLSLQLCGLGW